MSDIKLITLTDPRSATAEGYRALRTQLMYGRTGKALHTLLVTSTAKDDGKSTAAANLAVVLAQSGQRTILVDADLHRPAQPAIWGLGKQPGLDVLMNDDRTLANPPLIETSVPNLSLLLPGELPPVPADVLTHQRMGEIIGLFLKERIEPGLSPEETVRQIREQEGLALLPHGFDPLKRFRLRDSAREAIAAQIDIVESYNARISHMRWNEAAAEWAKGRQLPVSAGSDAHLLSDIGAAWLEAPFQLVNTPQDLLHCLQQGVPTGVWTHPVQAFLQKQWHRLMSRLGLK